VKDMSKGSVQQVENNEKNKITNAGVLFIMTAGYNPKSESLRLSG
jgi:hypothetical protein